MFFRSRSLYALIRSIKEYKSLVLMQTSSPRTLMREREREREKGENKEKNKENKKQIYIYQI